MPIIVPIPRTERRLMQKTIHKTKDKNHARRLTVMLMLHRGDAVSHVAALLNKSNFQVTGRSELYVRCYIRLPWQSKNLKSLTGRIQQSAQTARFANSLA